METFKSSLPRFLDKAGWFVVSPFALSFPEDIFVDFYVATLEGRIIKSVVQKNGFKFVLLLVNWIGVAIPATFINSMIRYLESKLSLAFRTELANHAYEKYFSNQTYYRGGELGWKNSERR